MTTNQMIGALVILGFEQIEYTPNQFKYEYKDITIYPHNNISNIYLRGFIVVHDASPEQIIEYVMRKLNETL